MLYYDIHVIQCKRACLNMFSYCLLNALFISWYPGGSSSSICTELSQLMQIMDALIQLDIINCRAKHADWLSGIRPSFCEKSDDHGSINISGVGI